MLFYLLSTTQFQKEITKNDSSFIQQQHCDNNKKKKSKGSISNPPFFTLLMAGSFHHVRYNEKKRYWKQKEYQKTETLQIYQGNVHKQQKSKHSYEDLNKKRKNLSEFVGNDTFHNGIFKYPPGYTRGFGCLRNNNTQPANVKHFL